MSPRRRLFLGAAFVAVVVAVAGVLLAVRPQGGGAGAKGARAVAQDVPGPVLLVTGYGGSTRALDVLAGALRRDGRDVEVVRPVGDGTGDLVAQAKALGAAAQTKLAAGAPSVDVVGYSAGGVVARIWATQQGGARVARRIVTLGSPHHGTQVVALALQLTGDCPQGCRQLTPDSDLLAALPQTAAGPRWTSIWTDADTVVTPPSSAQLDGAVDVTVQAVCPDARTQHGTLPTDPLVVGLVDRALGVPPLREAPGRGQCDTLRAKGSGLLGVSS